jgi:hypothetical protein
VKRLTIILPGECSNKPSVIFRTHKLFVIAKRGSRQTVSKNAAQPPTFNGNTSWSEFRRQFYIVAKHNHRSHREKSTYLITALKGRAADVLPGIPTNTTYEDTLQALEDRFGDQHFAAAYRCQLTTRTQKAGESLQDFATAIELLAHRAYPTLPEGHIGREAGKAFAYGVHDPDIKIQLLLGGEKTVNEALRQALELQAVPDPTKITQRYVGGASHPPPGKETQSNQDAGAVENQATSKVIATTEGKQKITSVRNEKANHQETSGNCRKGRNGDQVTTEK